MLRKLKINNAEFRSGLFIIFSVALLVFCILWLRYFAVTPEKKIVARFEDPGNITTGMPVYFRGVNVGKVPKVGFSENYMYTYVTIDLYRQLELPVNVSAIIRTEGITGQKYLSLVYPEKPSTILLVSGDVIEGETPFGLDDVQDLLKDLAESGRLDKIINNVESAIASANQAANTVNETSANFNALITRHDGNIDNIFNNTSDATAGLKRAMASINTVVEDPEIKASIKNTVTGVDRIIHETEESKLVNNLNSTVCKTYTVLNQTEETLSAACDASKRFDCVAKNASSMLSKRFLLFKLMFGRPGSPLDECKNK